jgi:transaldolase
VLPFSAAVYLFVESADPEAIRGYVAAGSISGVSTSASALTAEAGRAGRSPRDLLRAICDAAKGTVRVEMGRQDGQPDEMLREARGWAEVAVNVVVTLPPSEAGLEVVRACAAARVQTGVGVCPSAERALVAARAGATHVSAPLDRVAGADVGDGIRKLVALLRAFGLPTLVVAEAIRTPADIIDAALAGAQAVTAPAAVLRELAENSRPLEGGG